MENIIIEHKNIIENKCKNIISFKEFDSDRWRYGSKFIYAFKCDINLINGCYLNVKLKDGHISDFILTSYISFASNKHIENNITLQNNLILSYLYLYC